MPVFTHRVFARALLGLTVLSSILASTPGALRAQCGGARPLSTYLQRATDLRPVNIGITETPQPDGRVLMGVTLGVENLDSGRFADLTIAISELQTYQAEVVSNAIPVNAVGPGATIAPGVASIQFIVQPADVAALRTRLLAGELIDISGYEEWQLTGPARALDAATVAAYASEIVLTAGTRTLVFSEITPLLASLQPGDLLVEDPAVYTLVTRGANPGPGAILAGKLPFEVTATVAVGDEFHVTGRVRLLHEVIRDATFLAEWRCLYDSAFRDPADPDLENNYDDEETADRAEQADIIRAQNPRDGRLADLDGFVALPMRLNDVSVSDLVRVSGEVHLRSSGLRHEIKIRNFQVKKALIHMDAGVEANLAIEILDGTDTTGDPLAEKEVDVLAVPLPPVPFSIAGVPMSLTPSLVLKVGASVDAPTGLTIPFVSYAVVGMDMGWEQERGFFYEPIREIVPLEMSDPDILDTLAATGSAWTELDFNILVNGFAGPQFAVRAQADFTVNPFGDPWWKIEAGPDLLARFIFSFDPLGISVTDLGEVHLASYREVIAQAPGPLLPSASAGDGVASMRLAGSSADAGLARPAGAADRASGDTVRWARSLLYATIPGAAAGSGGYDTGFAVALPDGGSIIGGMARTGANFLTRLTAQGDVVWNKGAPAHLAIDAALDGDAHIVVVGMTGGNPWIERLTLDGVLVWRQAINVEETFDPTHLSATVFNLHQVLRGTDSGGAVLYHVVGSLDTGTILTTDPVVATFDQSGALLWMRRYAADGSQDPGGATLTRDGRIILCGSTDSDVAAPAQGTSSDHTLLVNSNANAMLMAIEPDGTLAWSHVYPSRGGFELHDIVEAPDGRLWATGRVPRTVVQTIPTLFVGVWEADGTPQNFVMVEERAQDPWPDDLAAAGDTAYDTGRRIAWTPNGPVVAGFSGIGTAQTGFLLGLTEELGVRFWTAFDGADVDSLDDLAVMDDGVLVMGNTRSLTPLGGTTRSSTLLAKVPWEGIVRFAPGSGMRTVMLQPRVYKASGTLDFMVTSSLGDQTYTADQDTLAQTAETPTPVLTTVSINPMVNTSFAADAFERGLPPEVTTAPSSITVVAGEPLDLSVVATGTGVLAYQWLKDGAVLPGAAGAATLSLPSSSGADAGLYTVAVTDINGTVVSTGATVTVLPRERVLNLSTRGEVGLGDDLMIGGFVVSGAAPKRMLIRAVGPTLTPLGVPGALDDPELRLFDAGANEIAHNTDWALAPNAVDIAEAGADLGAFGLDPASKDAALLVTLSPGLYSARVTGTGASTGIALLELYDADEPAVAARLVNLSTRLHVRSGASVGIAGLVSEGAIPPRMLIRAVGPELARLGIAQPLPDPKLQVFSGADVILEVDDWIDDGSIVSTTSSVGAFSLTPGGRDAAIIVQLPVGTYTVMVSDSGSGDGIALLEVYTIP